jgi:hypothetical protein
VFYICKIKYINEYYIIILSYKLFLIVINVLNKISIIHRINIWERSFLLLCEPLRQVGNYLVLQLLYLKIGIKVLLN